MQTKLCVCVKGGGKEREHEQASETIYKYVWGSRNNSYFNISDVPLWIVRAIV